MSGLRRMRRRGGPWCLVGPRTSRASRMHVPRLRRFDLACERREPIASAKCVEPASTMRTYRPRGTRDPARPCRFPPHRREALASRSRRVDGTSCAVRTVFRRDVGTARRGSRARVSARTPERSDHCDSGAPRRGSTSDAATGRSPDALETRPSRRTARRRRRRCRRGMAVRLDVADAQAGGGVACTDAGPAPAAAVGVEDRAGVAGSADRAGRRRDGDVGDERYRAGQRFRPSGGRAAGDDRRTRVRAGELLRGSPAKRSRRRLRPRRRGATAPARTGASSRRCSTCARRCCCARTAPSPRAISQNPLDPDAHERAALLLGAFALRDAAGRSTDVRPALCRLTSHLAVAAALRGAREPGVAGRLAEAVLVTLVGRERDALARLDALEVFAPTREVRAWARALRLRNTGDWRIAIDARDLTLLERLEEFRALVAGQDDGAALAWLDRRRPEPVARLGLHRAGKAGLGRHRQPVRRQRADAPAGRERRGLDGAGRRRGGRRGDDGRAQRKAGGPRDRGCGRTPAGRGARLGLVGGPHAETPRLRRGVDLLALPGDAGASRRRSRLRGRRARAVRPARAVPVRPAPPGDRRCAVPARDGRGSRTGGAGARAADRRPVAHAPREGDLRSHPGRPAGRDAVVPSRGADRHPAGGRRAARRAPGAEGCGPGRAPRDAGDGAARYRAGPPRSVQGAGGQT